MRQRFEQQTSLGILAINEVKFSPRNLKSRDELMPVLLALQHLYATPALNEAVFTLLEKRVCGGKKKTGRKGMDLWHILVLAVVRHTLGTNWDRLEHIANNDLLTRKILGVYVEKFGIEEQEFCYQTIVDNVSLIDEELLIRINELVVKHGHDLLKKKEDGVLRLKTDSFVLETDVHFPTDLNLVWDSARKCLDMVEKLRERFAVKDMRKIKYIRKEFKSLFRSTSQQVFKGRKEEKKKQAVRAYLDMASGLQGRFEVIISTPFASDIKTMAVIEALRMYNGYLVKFIDLTNRRLLKGESIPASEKVHSIFEEHTEWISKGKPGQRVELGHLVLLTTDQYHFIVDYRVMEKEKDAPQVNALLERIGKMFPAKTIYSHSFDKGFYSIDNYAALEQAGTAHIILPKRGKLNKAEKEREHTPEFKALRNQHSAVESNINMLEHHGMGRCPDKGIAHYKNYAGLSVLAYNLHILGNHLLAAERKKDAAITNRKQRLFKQAA
jgi:IS5 family transposase